MASPPVSPTLCRPQHVDRERVRAALRSFAAHSDGDATGGESESESESCLLFHEAVVVASPPRRPRALQLLALTRAAVLLLPLTSATDGRGVTRLPLERVARIERVTAGDAARRALLLAPSSELYCLSVLDGGDGAATDVWIASFEPDTRVFAHVARACRVHLQRRLLRLGGGCDAPDALELSRRLASLLDDLVTSLAGSRPFHDSAQLLLELAAAVSSSPRLQRLVLGDKTRLAVPWASGVVLGLPALLVELLRAVAAAGDEREPRATCEDRVELAGGVARILAAALLGCHWLRPERDAFLRAARPPELVRALQSAALACYDAARAHGRSEAWHVLWEELLDAQTALLLELDDALADEEAEAEVEGVAQTLVATDGFFRWLDKLVKRICEALASVQRHVPALDAEDAEDDEDGEETRRRRAARLWSLALWRHVALLDLLVAYARAAVLARLNARRRDYIDLYLRGGRFLPAMRAAGASHVADAARRLDGLAAALDAASAT